MPKTREGHLRANVNSEFTFDLDVDAETLNAMIVDLAHELGCPCDVSPDLVELGEIPQHVYGFNRGCMREGKPSDGVTIYREGQRWRRKVIAELRQRPEWVQKWLADAEMDRKVKQLCEQKGLKFAPWKCPPWMIRADDELPGAPDRNNLWDISQPLARRLRRQLEAEIKGKA